MAKRFDKILTKAKKDNPYKFAHEEVLGCNKKITTIKVPIDNALEVISLFVEN